MHVVQECFTELYTGTVVHYCIYLVGIRSQGLHELMLTQTIIVLPYTNLYIMQIYILVKAPHVQRQCTNIVIVVPHV